MDRPSACQDAPARAPRCRRTLPLLCAAGVALAALGPGGATAPEGCLASAHRLESLTIDAPALERAKRILVYLPPGYGCEPRRRYPVVYFNDGHDLFARDPFAAALDPPLAAEIARREAWYGSWRLEVQLDAAIAARRLPPLVAVGIASDDGMRSRDLAPAPWSGSHEARGLAYGAFVAGAVVAAVETRFGIATDRRCRAIAGASLGANSALQIGLAHPDRFGLVLALSPVLSDQGLAGALATAWRSAGPPQHVLVDLDDDPIGRADRRRLEALAATSARRTILLQTTGGRHAIASWADRVVPALTRLLANGCPP